MSTYPKVFIKKYQLDYYYNYVVIKVFHDQCWKGYGACNYQVARSLRLNLISNSTHSSLTCNQNREISRWSSTWQPIAQKIKSGEWK